MFVFGFILTMLGIAMADSGSLLITMLLVATGMAMMWKGKNWNDDV